MVPEEVFDPFAGLCDLELYLIVSGDLFPEGAFLFSARESSLLYTSVSPPFLIRKSRFQIVPASNTDVNSLPLARGPLGSVTEGISPRSLGGPRPL